MLGNGASCCCPPARRGEPTLSHTLPNDACGDMNLPEGTALGFVVESWGRSTYPSGSKSKYAWASARYLASSAAALGAVMCTRISAPSSFLHIAGD